MVVGGFAPPQIPEPEVQREVEEWQRAAQAKPNQVGDFIKVCEDEGSGL